MTPTTFTASLTAATPPPNLPAPLEALWWDARGDWARAHSLVDELETPDAMAVHAYLHRKEGSTPTPTTGTASPAPPTNAPPSTPSGPP
jgi:hypothetical protein